MNSWRTEQHGVRGRNFFIFFIVSVVLLLGLLAVAGDVWPH
jgi:hypothetical protein